MQTLQSDPAPKNRSTASTSVPGSSRRVALLAWLRHFFFMTDEMVRARSRHFARTAPGFKEYETAKCCMLTAESLREDARAEMAALAVQREAMLLALEVLRIRNCLECSADSVTLWGAFLKDPMGARLTQDLNSSEKAEIGRFIGADGSLPSIPIAAAEQATLARVLSTIVEPLLDSFGSNSASVRRVWQARMLRCVGLPLLAVGLFFCARFWLNPAPVNLALHKPVELSSAFNPGVYRPEGLVDGDVTQIGIHTLEQSRPWAQIDLGQEYTIRRVVVTNRSEFEERAIPLEIDTSLDGATLTRFAGRNEKFHTWEAKGQSTRARYVRLTVARPSALHLSEVEVY